VRGDRGEEREGGGEEREGEAGEGRRRGGERRGEGKKMIEGEEEVMRGANVSRGDKVA
jgi:hypothetical protein